MTDSIDPFAHLHDEHYRDRYANPRVGHNDMVFVGGRPGVSLDGPWAFTLDLFDEGLRQKWFADEPGPVEAWESPRDYDASGGETIDIPSSFTALKPEWRFFEGSAWYTRVIGVEPAPDRRLFLRVGAANYLSRIFLNGRFIAAHEGGSTPFFVELTDHIRSGRNRLQINVDNRRDPRRVPMHHIDWFNHGGVFREIALFDLPPVFIKDFGASLVPDGTFSRIKLDVELSNPVDGTVEATIPQLDLTARFQVSAGRGEAVIEASPRLWSPGDPYLHDIVVRFGEDHVTDRVGFREIRTEGTRIVLNGDDIFLRGVCVHEDDVALGRVTDESDIRRRFMHARELGCNFLRLAHYPHHERVAEIADEIGLLLWAEIPVYWAIRFEDKGTLHNADNQLRELIRRDRNRASVIAWGVGNENADTDARFRFMSKLAEATREADPTRLVTAACLINRETFQIEDRLAETLDVIGINEYFGWYEDESGLARLLANSSPGKPVIISESGAGALVGHRGNTGAFFTEERQAEYYRKQFDILPDWDYVRGFCAWILYDFASERRQNPFQTGFNRKGLVAEDKATKKLAFDALAAAYGKVAKSN